MPLDVYVAYRKPATFKTSLSKIEIPDYIHKLHIAKVYQYEDYFKLRMDGLRALMKHPTIFNLSIDVDECSLEYTTVWAFQTWRNRVELDDGTIGYVDRKEYNLLSGRDVEYKYDELLGV